MCNSYRIIPKRGAAKDVAGAAADADLAGRESIAANDILEAIQCRSLDRRLFA